ncbi:hypothetical protein TNCT_197911 [Trichonephila clavata]|uniref:Uncharacterized protein n=1 Tax=Trichonephila clavata TaxID=2740835 RepID=A0A8X6J1J4_TRICU|nr:hypothetical protein TNCT_197911 [Trichonephila clavata]
MARMERNVTMRMEKVAFRQTSVKGAGHLTLQLHLNKGALLQVCHYHQYFISTDDFLTDCARFNLNQKSKLSV